MDRSEPSKQNVNTRVCCCLSFRFGIRCNCVLPGFITTPMTDKVPEKVLTKVKSDVEMENVF